jgi:hypothetical protein
LLGANEFSSYKPFGILLLQYNLRELLMQIWYEPGIAQEAKGKVASKIERTT